MNKELILNRLRGFYDRNKRMPTYGEMCKLLGYRSKGAVRYVVQKLIEEGVLSKDASGKLLPKDLFSIPMYGVIKAGSPTGIDVQEDSRLNLHVLFNNVAGGSFALRVSGDSMVEEGINDGDVVFVNKDLAAKNGDIVAACVDGEWTVKYLNKNADGVVLLPANKKHKPIYPKNSLEIGGVVTHVVRSYK